MIVFVLSGDFFTRKQNQLAEERALIVQLHPNCILLQKALFVILVVSISSKSLEAENSINMFFTLNEINGYYTSICFYIMLCARSVKIFCCVLILIVLFFRTDSPP